MAVLTHYGNGKLACLWCGEDRLPCLTLDHINDNGAEHRRQLNGDVYHYLRKKDYPEGYQTLYMNCQWIKKADKAQREGLESGLTRFLF